MKADWGFIMIEVPICPACGSEMQLKETQRFLYGDGKPRKFYGCTNYPICRETHGAHPDGTPLGIPGNAEVRALRRKLHDLMDEIWPWENAKRRKQGYTWLRFHSKSGHVAQMERDELLETIKKVEELNGDSGSW